MYKRFLILIFFTLAFRLNAGNFYIDKNASGSDNGSSWSDAWENFQNINWDSIKPGDTIFVSGGTDSVIYTDFMEIGASGVESNLVTITKGIDPGHNGRVIIEGLNNEKTTAFHIEDKNFLKISNFEIRRFTGGGSIRVENSIGSVIEKNKILGYGSCVKIYNSFNCIIRENVLTTHENTPTQTDGIYASQNTDNVYENNNIIILNQDSYP
ncbi:MAG: hypothetical protein KDF60_07890, partial [Calditrichaeota bacterium]|nr:hypothetical protein [Calditrichota bacterium]